MAIKEKNNEVDKYIDNKLQDWQKPYARELRSLLDSIPSSVEETIKWGAPAYVGKRNIAGIVGLKNHISLWLYEGALLEDPHSILYQASDSTKSLRQIRFNKGDNLPGEHVKELIHQAAINDEKGLKVEMPKVKRPKEIPSPLKELLVENPKAKEHFEAMAPSNQREYVNYIKEAKRTDTKERRAAKSIKLLLQGKGLNDKYKP